MNEIVACVERPLPRRAIRSRYRRWDQRRKSSGGMANLSWHARFWYAVHIRFNDVCFGEGFGKSDWGHRHRTVMAGHRWLCRRWVPEWDRYLARHRHFLAKRTHP